MPFASSISIFRNKYPMKTADRDPKHLPLQATHKLHGALLRLLYKVVSPTHPRG